MKQTTLQLEPEEPDKETVGPGDINPEDYSCEFCESDNLYYEGEVFLYGGPNALGFWCLDCGKYNLKPLPEGYQETKFLESDPRAAGVKT